MIKTIIKRNGSRESFSAEKLNGWSEWAAEKLGRGVNWSEVVLHTVSSLPESCTSKDLQEQLIQYCLGKNTWEYNLMAGRLYAALLIRLIHKSDTYPTVKNVQDRLVKAGLMRKLDYSEEEYAEIEKIIDHNYNLKYPHYALHQNRKKYALQNKTTGTEYETSQFTYMRMAMAAAEFEPKEIRLKEVKEYYLEFAQHKINIPTPYYVNLGTKLSGFASCFPAGTVVSMLNGFKNIEDVQVGDMVVTHNNQSRRVYHIQNKPYNGKFTVINTTATYQNELTPTEDHRIYAIKNVHSNWLKMNDTKVSREWIKADNLRNGDFVKLSYDQSILTNDLTIWDIIKDHSLIVDNYTLSDDVISKNVPNESDNPKHAKVNNVSIFNKDMFRLFGYFIAEGCVSKPVRENSESLAFTFNINEKEYINDVINIIDSLGANVNSYDDVNQNATKIACNSKVLVALFDTLIGCGFNTKRLSKEIQLASHALQKELLVGIIRGDGCAIRSGYKVTLYNIELVRQLRDVALRLSLPVTLNKAKQLRKGATQLDATLIIIADGNSDFIKYVGKNTNKILADKRSNGGNVIFLNDGAYAKVRNLSSYDKECTVYDLSVEEDASFSASGVSVHNCCVYTTKDTAQSLAAADHIAYMMTVMSAGIGYHLKSRSMGDPVRGGAIEHQGKVPYARAYVGALGANLQNGRGGAGTLYYNAYDPEVETIAKLKNPITPLTRQVRGSDYSFGSNRLVVKQAAKNGDIALFSYYHAPELYEAIYSGDQDYFEELYEKFLASNLPRKMISARKVVLNALTEAFETGRHYEHFTDHLNAHTPFKDKIYSGNLCVTGDTKIKYCDENGVDYVNTIKDFAEQFDETKRYYALSYDVTTKKTTYSLIEDAGVTANTDALYHIIDNLGNVIKCTPDHKVYTTNRGFVSAKSIVNGDSLVSEQNGVLVATHVQTIKIDLVEEQVYDIKVRGTECFFANGILVHNCVEIALPTAGFNSVEDLYKPYDDSLNFIEFKTEDKVTHKLYSFDKVECQRGIVDAKDLRLEDTYNGKVITKVIQRSSAPEIAVCNIGGVIVPNIANDEEYAKSTYRILKLISYGIHNSEYVFKNLEDSAKSRMSAGVGIVGLAHLMAKKGQKYDTQEGKNYIHEVAETHAWHLYNAALRIGQEQGNAPWMHKTKWPEGWTPLETYNKNVDQLVTVGNKRDWKGLKQRIIANGGIGFSVCISHMPAESCLEKSTKIRTTEKGIMSLEDIFNTTGLDLAEEVMSITPLTGGKWYDLPEPIMVDTLVGPREATQLWLNGNTNYVEIEMEDGSIFKATHHHKFLVQKEDGTKEWKMVINLEEGDDIVQIE